MASRAAGSQSLPTTLSRPIFPVGRGQDRRAFRPVIPGVKLPPSLDSSTPTSPYRPFSFHFACLIAAEPVRSFTQSVLVAAASHQEAKRPFRFWSFLSSIPRRISPCIQNKSLVAPLVYCPDRTIMKFSSAAVVAILALCESTFAGGIEVRTSPFRSVPDAGTH
jgi:hypothetical protein